VQLSWIAAVTMLVFPAAGAWGEADDEGSALHELVRQGVTYNAEGELDRADAVWERLRTAHPTHPAGPTLAVSTIYLRQVLDDNDTRYDAAIERTARRAVALGEARLATREADAELHYYTGQALFDLARLEGIRGRVLSAGRHGEQARNHLERALELDPAFVEPKLPLGMYHYYAGLLPDLVKWLRWLWFVPWGESETGLRYLDEVYEGGGLYAPAAASTLVNIYTYHEPGHLHRALALGAELCERFPDNRLFQYQRIEATFEAGRYDAAVEAALALEQRPLVREGDEALRRATTIIRARAELHRGRPDTARKILERFGPDGPERPSWANAWILLLRSQVFDVEGQRSRAVSLYERVTALVPPKRSQHAAARAEEGLTEPFALPKPAELRAAPAQ